MRGVVIGFDCETFEFCSRGRAQTFVILLFCVDVFKYSILSSRK